MRENYWAKFIQMKYMYMKAGHWRVTNEKELFETHFRESETKTIYIWRNTAKSTHGKSTTQ